MMVLEDGNSYSYTKTQSISNMNQNSEVLLPKTKSKKSIISPNGLN